MHDVIRYYFSSVSPFAWFGHRQLMAIAGKHGKQIDFLPVTVMDLWKASGSVPLAQRSPMRQAYRLIELHRIAHMRGLDINLKPKFFPVDGELANRIVIALSKSARSPADFSFSVGEALWAKQANIADEAVIGELLMQNGFEPGPLLEMAKSNAVSDRLADNTRNAIEANAIGVPCYVYKGEPFWGQDRLDHLNHMIVSGRAPFHEM